MLNTAAVSEIVKGSDAVISAYSPGSTPAVIVDATNSLVAGLNRLA
ncbi:MAG: hypothetical protein WA869_26135 [Alloacidobacterium sp.]